MVNYGGEKNLQDLAAYAARTEKELLLDYPNCAREDKHEQVQAIVDFILNQENRDPRNEMAVKYLEAFYDL